MGLWNFYFIAKLFLYFGHYIGFHVFANMAFALLLVIPIQHSRLRILRQVLAVPTGIALFYYDTWLLPFSRLFSHASQLEGFNLMYLMELVGRFISFPVITTLALLYAAYFFAQKKLRVSTFVFLAMLVPLLPVTTKKSDVGTTAPSPGTTESQLPPGSPEASANRVSQPASDEELTTSLDAFYKHEATRVVSFAPPVKSDAPFDIIFLHICSLSWDDLSFVKEKDNPLFKRFNIIFTNFNSAASYSGPAAIRVLRGSCGQQKQTGLYKPSSPQCQTFDNLQQAGFEPQLAMNHDGHFDNFLAEVLKHGGLNMTPFDIKGASSYLKSFDESPVYDDYTVLSKWWEKRLKMPSERVALFYNTISLHDGNRYSDGRYSGNNPNNTMEIYPPRLKKLLGDIDLFFTRLNTSGRRAVVVFIPEHGASIRGDKMQIPGMREIPSPRISIVPVGIKLIGIPEDPGIKPLTVPQPTSYLAVSKLLSDFIGKTPFSGSIPDLEEYVRNLPSTEFVSENEDIVIVRRGNQYHMRSKDSEWVEYDPSE